jgi:hypothetical protein
MKTTGKSKSGGKSPVAGEAASCEECSRWKLMRKKIRVAELMATAIQKLKARFATEDFKPSIADYLKLVEIEEELENSSDAIKEIKVTWIEPKESDIAK